MSAPPGSRLSRQARRLRGAAVSRKRHTVSVEDVAQDVAQAWVSGDDDPTAVLVELDHLEACAAVALAVVLLHAWRGPVSATAFARELAAEASEPYPP